MRGGKNRRKESQSGGAEEDEQGRGLRAREGAEDKGRGKGQRRRAEEEGRGGGQRRRGRGAEDGAEG
jgi:hypothetical protein